MGPGLNVSHDPCPGAAAEQGDREALDHVHGDEDIDDSVELMTMAEIMNGKGTYYPGLLPLIYAYLESIHISKTDFTRIDAYLRFIQARSTGQIKTNAAWMRDFVTQHPDYKRDSVVTDCMAYDLVRVCDEIGRGLTVPSDLLGDAQITPIMPEDAYGCQLNRDRLTHSCRHHLLARYTGRMSRTDRVRSRSMSGASDALSPSSSAPAPSP